MAVELAQRIKDRSALVGVIGLGYVGLPLVQAFSAAGFRTMGFDVDQAKVDRLLSGESYIGHIPSSAIAGLISADVVSRTAGFLGLPWATDVCEYLLFTSTFLGAPWVLRQGAHVRVDILVASLRNQPARILESTVNIAGIAICDA